MVTERTNDPCPIASRIALCVELIEAIKKTEDINEHVLSKDTENQQWFNQTSLEDQTITLEVPVVHFPKPTDPKLNEPISRRCISSAECTTSISLLS